MGSKSFKVVKTGKHIKLLPLISIVVVAIMAVGMVALFSVLFKPGTKTPASPLETPTGLEVYRAATADGYDYFASFNPVEGAGRYVIYIQDATNTQNQNSFRQSSTSTVVKITKYITEAKKYKIGVQAINTQVAAYSSDIVYTNYENKMKLQTPQIHREHEIFSWNSIDFATSYNLVLRYAGNTESVSLQTTSYDLSSILAATQQDPTAVRFTLSVKAVYSGNLLWEDSGYSSAIEYVVTRTLEKTELELDDLTHNLSWAPVDGATEYEIWLKKDNGLLEKVVSVDANDASSYDLTEFIDGVGLYSGYIKVVSDDEYTFSSVSDTFEFLVSTQISTPSILETKVDGEYLEVTIQPVDGSNEQSYYYLRVYNIDDQLIYDARVTKLKYQFLLTVNPSGYYKITVTGKNDIRPDLYLDSEESEPYVVEVESQISAPENVVYAQPKVSGSANLNWTKVSGATSYYIYLFTLDDGLNEIPFGDPIIQTSSTLTLPFTVAGYYYARVKALATESQFYKDSEFSQTVTCMFREQLAPVTNLTITDDPNVLAYMRAIVNYYNELNGTDVVVRDDDSVILWTDNPEVTWYTMYVNDNSYGVDSEKRFNLYGISYERYNRAAINLRGILDDPAEFPSSETIPYQIKVQARNVGTQDNELYEPSTIVSTQYYLVRELDLPQGLTYTQTDNKNEAFFTWNEVENAAEGYCVLINGAQPVALQRVMGTSCEVSSYLVPGINTIAVRANKCLNYLQSDFVGGQYAFTYFMEPASNVNFYEEDGNYYVSFKTHKFANYYRLSFYATYDDNPENRELLGQQAESGYYANNEVVTILIQPENIKKYDDCITTIELLTAYSDGIAGPTDSYFDSSYILGDNVDLTYSKSVTRVYTYVNETVLVMIDESSVQILETTQTSRTIKFNYPVGYADKVRIFSVTITRIDSINGNTYLTKSVAGSAGEPTDNINYLSYTVLFDNLDIGEYTVTMYAISLDPRYINSGKTYGEFTVTIVQATPDNIIIYKNLSGQIIAQWDLIASHTKTTSYTVGLFRYTAESPVLVQQWSSKTSSGDTIIRDGRQVNVIQINFNTEKSATDRTKTIASNMISGLYFLTVKTNAYGDYFFESAVGTMDGYYAHNASVITPDLMVNQQENIATIPFDADLSYTLYYHTTETTNPTAELNIAPVTRTIDGNKYTVFNLLYGFTNEFDVGTYYLSAIAHRSVGSGADTTVIDSLRSELRPYNFMKEFSSPSSEGASSNIVYEFIDNRDKATLETSFNMVTVGNVVASDYSVRVYSGIFAYVITANILFDSVNNYYKIVAITDFENDTYTTYTPTSVQQQGSATTYIYAQNETQLYILTVDASDKTVFLKIFDLTNFVANTQYTTTLSTLKDEAHFYTDSKTPTTLRFKYYLRWLPPTIYFVTNENNVVYETRYVELTDENNFVNIKLDGSINGASTAYNYRLRVTNLLSNEAPFEKDLNKNRDIQNISGVGTVFKLDASVLSESALYKVEFCINSSGKVASRFASPLYVYNQLKMDAPAITKIKKATTPLDASKQKDIILQWNFDGYGTGTLNSILAQFSETPFFTVTIDECDENLDIVASGLSFTKQIYLNDAGLTKDGNTYSYTITLEDYASLSTFVWIKPTEDAFGNPIDVTHYKFTVSASEYTTDLTTIFNDQGFVSSGTVNPVYAPTSAQSSKKYVFFADSDVSTVLFRCDNKLNMPQNLRFQDGPQKYVLWDEVFDPVDTDTTVGYKYVYYTMGIDGVYNLMTASGEMTLYFNSADNKFYTESAFNEGSEVDFNVKKSDYEQGLESPTSPFWLDTNVQSIVNGFEANITTPCIYGVWVFAYATNLNASIGNSKIFYGTTVYSQEFVLPTEISWNVSEDSSRHTIVFNNTIMDQLNSAELSDYLDIYGLTLGGYNLVWFTSNIPGLENSSTLFTIDISQLYNANVYLNEYVDDNNIKHLRLYDWQLVLNNFERTVYNPTADEQRISYALFTGGKVIGQVYRATVVERNVNSATVTENDEKYYVTFEQISSATKYELQFVNAENIPILDNLNYFANGVVPDNYVEKLTLSLDYDTQTASYVENGQTKISTLVINNGNITVDITPLLNGRAAGTYYLAIYTLADPEKRISLNGLATTSSVTMGYQKSYAPVENIEFSYDSEGILQTISWTETRDSDGGMVHDFAYYKIQVWKKVPAGQNYVLLNLSGSGDKQLNAVFSGVQGISGLTNVLTGSNIWFDQSDPNDPRIFVNIGNIFKQYLVNSNGIKLGGEYTVGIVVAPASSTKSAFSESRRATADFVHRVKLEFDETTTYVQFLIDGYLNEADSTASREAVFTDNNIENASLYLSNETVDGNFNIKSLQLLQWLPEIQSTEIAVYLKSGENWIETVRFSGIDLQRNYRVFLHEGTVQLRPGVNNMAIQAVGINDFYVESELKPFIVKAYFKHPTPTITFSQADIVYEDGSASFAGTPTKLTLHLDDSWAQKRYGVVVYAYYYLNGVYEPYLAWQTSDQNGDDWRNRLIWTTVNGTACFIYPQTYTKNTALRGKVVNFMDFFHENANQQFGSQNMVSLIGPYQYVFRAKIFANTQAYADNYYLNSEYSQPSNVFTYTYQLKKPVMQVADFDASGNPIYENVVRDADRNATAVNISWAIDNVKFKTILKYSITVWDGQYRTGDTFSRGNGNPYNAANTVEYSVYIKVNFVATTPVYLIESVTIKNYRGTENAVLPTSFADYFIIQSNNIVFNMMPYIKSQQRVKQYVAGVYRYHIKAVNGKTAELSSNTLSYVQNSNINGSEFTGSFFAGADVDSDYNYYSTYIHSVPYPVTFSEAKVSAEGMLSMSLKDTYATARRIYITVNNTQISYLIESPNSNSNIYYSNIASHLVPGLENVVKVRIGAVEYYYDGEEFEATNEFSEWTHELADLKNITWSYNAGKQEISWNLSFSPQYAAHSVLDSGEGDLDADLVHFKLDVIYSSNEIEYNQNLSNAEIYSYLLAQPTIKHLVIKDLGDVNGTVVAKFRPNAKSYVFDLLSCINLVDETWIQEGALKGGFYTIKLTITAKDEHEVSPTGAENYLDGITYIINKHVLSPWKMSDSAEFWSEEREHLTTSNQSASTTAKYLWADNKDINWGIKFTVNEVDGNYPTGYRVYYWRDDSQLPFDNYFEVSGSNITVAGGYVYLNFKSGFSSVIQAGVYNFAWMAHSVADVAESSKYSYILTATGAETLGLSGSLSKYKGYGLVNFVRVSAPQLANELSNQSKTSCTISWTFIDNAGESALNLSFTARIKNFLGNYEDGQACPTGNVGYGPVVPSDERRYVFQSNGDTTLNMMEGDNFVSIQAVPSGNNGYYLQSNWSDLKLLHWIVTLPAPEIDVYLTSLSEADEWQGLQRKTVPENESAISSDIVNAYDTVNRGGTRETVGNETTFTGNITIQAKVPKTAVINNVAYLEIMTYDPVTNALFTQSNALCHYMVRADVNEGVVYRYRKRFVDYNNNANNSLTWTSDGDTRVGTCTKNNDGTVTFYVYGFKIYELLPTVTYTNVLVKQEDGSNTLFSGVKNFADIPQTYRFIVRAYTSDTTSEDAGFNYDYSLRMIAPEVKSASFEGISIKTISNNQYITNDTFEDYEIVLEVDKVSRHATHIMLYAFVDQERGNNYYNDNNDDYKASYDTNNYNNLRKHYMLFSIQGEIDFETNASPYGKVFLTITKGSDLWNFINQNTPNALYFAAQAVTESMSMYDFTTYDGDFYDDYTLEEPEQKYMILRYSESYIGQYFSKTIYRQFEKAILNFKLDYGQISNELFQSGERPEKLADSNILSTLFSYSTNLSDTNMALDPYMVVEENDFANARLSYEFDEIKKYAAYKITATLQNGTSRSKTVYSVYNDAADGAGLLDAEENFDNIVGRDNPVRYTFDGNTYIEQPILGDPCIYNLLLSLFATQNSGAASTGGMCTISLQTIKETRTAESLVKNFWISQDEQDQNSRIFVFYLRPKAVKLSLGNAVFNSNNPLVVDWESTIRENELLYPNSVNLSWTSSSPYVQTYKIDIMRADESTSSYVYNYNQGADSFAGTSQNLVAPTSGWGGDAQVYGSMTPSQRFNNWDERTESYNIDVACQYTCFVETNPVLDKYIGRSYPSGASSGGSTTNYTYYSVQLKYNTYNGITIQSSADGDLGSGEPSARNFNTMNFSTTTNGNSGASINLAYSGEFNQIGYTVFSVYGPYSYTINSNGSYTAVYDTKESSFYGFSPSDFRDAVNDLLYVNNAAGGVYTIRYRFVYDIEQNPTASTPFIQGELSNNISYAYYRNVYASSVALEAQISSVKVSATNEEQDFAAFFSVRIWQKSASGGTAEKAYSLGSFMLKRSVGLTQTSNEDAYVHNFDATKCDALSDTTIQLAQVSNFTSRGYTYYPGSLQGGENKYSVVITAGDPTYNIQCESDKDTVSFIIPRQYAPSVGSISLNQTGSATVDDYCSNISATAAEGQGSGSSGPTYVNCPTCHGTGHVECTRCHGEGCFPNSSIYIQVGILPACTNCGGSGGYYEFDPDNPNNANYVQGTGYVDCENCNGTGRVETVSQSSGDGSGGDSAESKSYSYTYKQTWHSAEITDMPTKLSFDIYNAYSYHYSLEYYTYTESGTRGKTTYVTYKKNAPTTVERSSSGFTYNSTKNGRNITSTSFSGNCYQVKNVVCEALCKPGFGDVIDGDWGSDTGTYTDNSESLIRASFGSGDSEEELFAEMVVTVSGKFEDENVACTGSKTIPFKATGKLTEYAYSRYKANAEADVKFTVGSVTGVCTEKTSTRSFKYNDKGQKSGYTPWEVSINDSFTAQTTNTPPSDIIMNLGPSGSGSSNLVINLTRPPNVTEELQKKEYSGGKVNYSVSVQVTWKDKKTQNTNSNTSVYAPAFQSYSGIRTFLLQD